MVGDSAVIIPRSLGEAVEVVTHLQEAGLPLVAKFGPVHDPVQFYLINVQFAFEERYVGAVVGLVLKSELVYSPQQSH